MSTSVPRVVYTGKTYDSVSAELVPKLTVVAEGTAVEKVTDGVAAMVVEITEVTDSAELIETIAAWLLKARLRMAKS